MPSSPNYKRDYAQEAKTAKARGEDVKNATRHRARYEMEKEGKAHVGDGKDVGHIKALGRGGTNSRSNLEMQDATANRSFSRNKDGSMKSETSKKERK
jgi:hypothetical protein